MKTTPKNSLIIMTIILCGILCSLIYQSCDYMKYAGGIKKDTQKTFVKNKEFISQLGFQGRIMEKLLCEKCDINRYTLKVELFQLSEWPSINNSQYPPYYIFNEDSVIIITVPKELFECVIERDTIIKDSNSLNLKVGNQEYLYLSTEKYQWLP